MRKRPLAFGCLLTILFLYFITVFFPPAHEDVSSDNGKEITVTGRIYKKEKVRQTGGQSFVIYLTDLSDAKPSASKLICYLKSGQEQPRIGSRVKLSGKVKAFEKASDPGQFDSYSYYQISGISYRLNQAIILEQSNEYRFFQENLYQLRCYFAGILAENLGEKEAALMQTMLLGEKSDLDKELKALYQRNGIAHILAISGLHISMLGMGLYKLLRRLGAGMKASAFAAVFLMLSYGTMTGFSVSVVRAILMFCIRMLAVWTERTYDMLTAVALSAVLILLEQPLYFYHSGFVFSFGCAAGIALVLPALTKECKNPAKPKRYEEQRKKLCRVVLSPLAIGTVSLPVYLWFYYQFPPYSILLNIFVIPLMSYVMAAGLLVVLFGMLCKPLALPFALLISGVFDIYETACNWCEQLPHYLLNFGKPKGWQLLLYLLVLVLVILVQKRVKLFHRWLFMAAAVVLLLIRPKEGLLLIFLDVGQGDCIYMESKEGDRFLIDAGSSSVNSVGEYRLLPFLKYQGVSQLDAVFVTHSDADHCNGVLELLEKGKENGISVACLVLPDVAEESRDEGYRELEEAAASSGTALAFMSAGQKLERDGLTLTCLHPDKGYETQNANAYSMVLEVSYGDFRALLTGDLEKEGEETLEFMSGEPYTLLKVAHHGSKNSTGEDFLEQTAPALAIISCGKNNSYGHPHKETLERLMEADCQIFTTPEYGAITVKVGKGVEVYGFLVE